MKGRKQTAAGRPALPENKRKRHAVSLKFDDEEIKLIEEAARLDHDKRANWLKRKGLKAAERIVRGAAGVIGDPSASSKS